MFSHSDHRFTSGYIGSSAGVFTSHGSGARRQTNPLVTYCRANKGMVDHFACKYYPRIAHFESSRSDVIFGEIEYCHHSDHRSQSVILIFISFLPFFSNSVTVNLLSAQYPGRETRAHVPMVSSCADLAASIVQVCANDAIESSFHHESDDLNDEENNQKIICNTSYSIALLSHYLLNFLTRTIACHVHRHQMAFIS
jgi:hypothetical protein